MESLYSRLFNDIFLSWRNEGWKQGECFLNIISLKEAPVQKGGTYLKVSALISVFTVNTQLLVLFVTPLNPSQKVILLLGSIHVIFTAILLLFNCNFWCTYADNGKLFQNYIVGIIHYSF